VIILFGSLFGVLVGLIVVGSSAPKGKAKLRALIASDQAILQSLPPGSRAANVLDARIQTNVTIYASGLVLPSARRGAAVMSVITAVCLAGALGLAWNNHSIKGDQFVYPFVAGLFAVMVWFFLGILLHRNPAWTTQNLDAAHVDQGIVLPPDDDNSSPTERPAGQPI